METRTGTTPATRSSLTFSLVVAATFEATHAASTHAGSQLAAQAGCKNFARIGTTPTPIAKSTVSGLSVSFLTSCSRAQTNPGAAGFSPPSAVAAIFSFVSYPGVTGAREYGGDGLGDELWV